MTNDTIRVGVLSLQGGVIEHVNMLKKIANVIVKELKSTEQIKVFDPHGMILPGGESTAMAIIAEKDQELFPYLQQLVHSQKIAVWGTCAGSIMLSNQVDHQKKGGQSLIGGLEVQISRNYFGRQINSFETTLTLNLHDDQEEGGASINKMEFEGIFIRAPAILKTLSDKVHIISDFNHTKPDGTEETVIVAVQQDNMLATVFHPELTNDNRFHQYFVDFIIKNNQQQQQQLNIIK
ncbi:SNO glutamine amidotransferase family protein [Cavenderia fasciculata]|uniref:SNO glutamine amidotransferase family protein n=1 Tax=Cavenderia fasciculata TaxID=261658 RepID=F4Q344_CACFS|nr:SNO glutamine amidotransferase family protein [Cavenderia fasciculata]EGG16766.1 SNO glutamine amidotransferase family protein [Cavenderia fasciculata]|eukprot:XP_004355240.1 SNO glutamine amidotransferase family protein [Cavenderia fasciculata]